MSSVDSAYVSSSVDSGHGQATRASMAAGDGGSSASGPSAAETMSWAHGGIGSPRKQRNGSAAGLAAAAPPPPSSDDHKGRSHTGAQAGTGSSAPLGDQNNVRTNGEAGDDLWSSILDSVQSSRVTPIKNVIMLGERRTGKSTLLAQLAATAPAAFVSHQSESADQGYTQRATNGGLTRSESTQSANMASGSGGSLTTSDLGLGYSYFDIGDHESEGEDIIGRVGVYQTSSSHPASLSLLPFAMASSAEEKTAKYSQGQQHALSTTSSRSLKDSINSSNTTQMSTAPQPSIDALKDSLFLVVLDWEAPWTFLSQLMQWLDVIRDMIDKCCAESNDAGQWSRERVVFDDMKERTARFIRLYTEPQGAGNVTSTDLPEEDIGETSTASAVVAVTNPAGDDDDVNSPLPEGCLSHNLGVPIVVVCTKADTIQQLERQRNFKEEQFDYIQQVLRTICLKYGAALFFTAQSQPPSFDVLRTYILHRLFAPLRQHSSTGAFAFPHRASTVERDVLVVPSGWDSFGKIRALREGFDCASMANGWEWDAAVERVRRAKGLPLGSREAEEAAEQTVDRRDLPGLVGSDGSSVGSAVKLYEDIVEDWDAMAAPTGSSQAHVEEPDAQAFLMQHYANLQREPDPRNKLVRQTSSGNLSETSSPASNKTGVVGPMGSGSLSLPGVERAMQDRLGDEGRTSKASRRADGRDYLRGEAGRLTPTQTPAHSATERGSSRPTSPLSAVPNSPGPGGSGGPQTPKQSEVLHSFFQSLLKDKAPPGGSSGGAGSSSRGGASRGERR